MNKISKVLVVFTFLFAINSFSQQRSSQEFKAKFYTVEQVNRSAINFEEFHVPVKVRGYLIQQMSRIMYKFEDDTGMLQLNIPPRLYPKNFYNLNIEIIVMGYVNFSDFDKTVIKVTDIVVPSF